jgi:outer membrane protein TolC
MVLRRMPLSCSYGLVNYADEQSRRDHLEASVRSSQDAMNLADAQNRVLDAERTLFTNQELLAQSQTAIVVDLVALALGGGWQSFPLEANAGSNGRSTAMAELRTPKPWAALGTVIRGVDLALVR